MEGWLQGTLASYAGDTVGATTWETEPYIYADTQHAIPFYLAREGMMTDENYEDGYILNDYRLGDAPQFAAAGQTSQLQAGFGPGLTLIGARRGAAYPNADRSAAEAAAGTPIWVILEWRLDTPLPGVRVAVDLVDTGGHRLATLEQPLMLEDAPRTTMPPDGVLHTYHLVELPVAQPPGEIRLEARAYDAATGEARLPDDASPRDSVDLGAMRVAPPLQISD